MEDRSEEVINTNLGNDNASKNVESSQKTSTANKTNTIIIRCPDAEDITKSYVRRCRTCFKKIEPNYYFLWEFMEFCNVLCISKFQGLNFKCTYCSRFINNTLFGKFYICIKKMFRFFCSASCMEHYKLTVKCCLYCQQEINVIGANGTSFCSKTCSERFNATVIQPNVPQAALCCVCKQEKPVNITLKHEGTTIYFCNKPCSIAYSFVKLQADVDQCVMCRYFFSQAILRKFTVYFGNVALFFCSTSCRNVYKLLKGKVVSCSWCKNERCNFGMIRKFTKASSQSKYICSVNCVKLYECSIFANISPKESSATEIPYSGISNNSTFNTHQNENKNGNNLQQLRVENKQFLTNPKTPIEQRNVATMCFIPKLNKDIVVKPDMSDKEIQTEETIPKIIPIPIPMYLPMPMAMYSVPVPTAVPFPLPVPVPVFVPITKQSSIVNIMTEIETMQNTVPRDPYEADLLKIADVIAEEKACSANLETTQDSFTDKENSLNTNLISNNKVTEFEINAGVFHTKEKVGGKRLCDSLDLHETYNKKKSKKISINYYLGVNAFQQWVKNSDMSQKSERDNTLFKKSILQMSPEELNVVLYLFIQDLKKPDGSNYAPDTLYYLCLGIQYYLVENKRTDNIFSDKPYSKFSNILNNIAEKFNSMHREGSHYIVTRVEEEHLWETKQLGSHSPQVLLSTLVYFNTKYYHCSTLEQHKNISFFQILKLSKKKSKSKSMMLRFHPKQVMGVKRAYEQYANEADRSRCPVSLYEFYLSKCPESVKSSNHSFYLEPEQYCTSDSPLWYTSSSLRTDTLLTMLNRIKIVKEINIALFTNK